MAPNSKAAIAKSGWSETTTIARSAASRCAIAQPLPLTIARSRKTTSGRCFSAWAIAVAIVLAVQPTAIWG